MKRFVLQLAEHRDCPACGFPLATNPKWTRDPDALPGHHSRCARAAATVFEAHVDYDGPFRAGPKKSRP